MIRGQEFDRLHLEGLGALHDDRVAVAHYLPVEGRQNHQLTARDLADLAGRACAGGADQRLAVDGGGRDTRVSPSNSSVVTPSVAGIAALDGVVADPGRRDEVVAEPAPGAFSGIGIVADDDVEADIAQRVCAEARSLLVPVHHVVHEDGGATLHGREPEA